MEVAATSAILIPDLGQYHHLRKSLPAMAHPPRLFKFLGMHPMGRHRTRSGLVQIQILLLPRCYHPHLPHPTLTMIINLGSPITIGSKLVPVQAVANSVIAIVVSAHIHLQASQPVMAHLLKLLRSLGAILLEQHLTRCGAIQTLTQHLLRSSLHH